MNTKSIIFITIGLILLFVIMELTKEKITGLLKLFSIRVDNAGNGHYGSSRGGGTRKHMGIDAKTKKGESIYAPFDLTFIRKAYPYGNDLKYEGALYRHKNGYLKIFYFNPLTTKVNFKKGDVIGYSQDISEKWGKPMLSHIHIELYDKNMNNLNPERYV